jgi:hypothetical protein
MKKITNLQLLVGTVLVSLGLWFFVESSMMAPLRRLYGYLAFLAFAWLLGVIADRFQRVLGEKNLWCQPVSEKFGAIFINVVMLVWLAAVVIVAVVILSTQSRLRIGVLALVFLVSGIGYGRFLQRRSTFALSLLPYGISAFAALVLLLIVAIAMNAAVGR